MSRTVGTDDAGVAAASDAVRAGAVLLYPTETVYGLGGDAGRSDVLARVRQLKGRGDYSPVLVLTDSWERVASWAGAGDAAARVMAHDPPLAVTLLLPAAPAAPPWLVGPEGLVGIRRTGDPFCAALVRAAGAPITSTSANRSGEPAPAELESVGPAIRAGADLEVDAGRRLPGVASTVARIDDAGRVTIVRPGPVDAATLESVAAGRR